MEDKEFIEIYEKDDEKCIRGLFVVKDKNKTPNEDSIIGIAQEDCKKGQIVKVDFD